jgi:hypothetical protein
MGLFSSLFGDNSGSKAAAAAMRENLAYIKEQAAKDQAARNEILTGLQPYVSTANTLDTELASNALSDAATARTRGNTLWDQYMTSVVPVQSQFYKEALDYGGLADQERAAGMATSDVRQQYAIQKGIDERALEAMGVNPNSGRFASANRAAELAAMAAAAGGATRARSMARDTGVQLRKEATSIGQNLIPGTQNFGNQALNFGTQASSSIANPVVRGLQLGQFKVGGTANAMNAVSGAASNYANTLANTDTTGIFPTLAGVGTAWALNKYIK